MDRDLKKKYDGIDYFNKLREMLLPYAFWDKNGQNVDIYGDGLSDDVLHRVMSSFLGGIDVTENMKQKLGVQYHKYKKVQSHLLLHLLET